MSHEATANAEFGFVLLHDGQESDIPDFYDPTESEAVLRGEGGWWQLAADRPDHDFHVRLDLLAAEPPPERAASDAAEFDLELAAGQLTLYSWEGETLIDVDVTPGWYRCRYNAGVGGELDLQVWPSG